VQAPVECPVCQVMFTRVALETHIDRCSGGGKSKDAKREWGKFMGGSTASSSVGKKAKMVSATKYVHPVSSDRSWTDKRHVQTFISQSCREEAAIDRLRQSELETSKSSHRCTYLCSRLVLVLTSLNQNVGITTETTKDPKVYTRLHSQWVILWNSNCDRESLPRSSRLQTDMRL
jgi:hypothetical protein